MLKEYPYWLYTQNYLGSQYPYFIENENHQKKFSFNIEDILNDISSDKKKIEIASVIEVLDKGYVFGDKTLVKGIKRSPWLGRLNSEDDWEINKIPKVSVNRPTTSCAALEIKKFLYEELLNHIDGFNKVGILLSGGSDSRIIAGILKEAQMKNDYNGDVVVYNWGMSQSRDVIYAKKIAELYNWEHIHFPLTPESLKENFYNSLMLGAEISPVNIHGMLKVRDDPNSEIVIAGSYGDSMGRGIYLDGHVSESKKIVSGNLNKLGLIKTNVMNEYETLIKNDYYQYVNEIENSKRFFKLSEIEQNSHLRELEQNAHYIRRLLGTAMSIIAQKNQFIKCLLLLR